MGRSEVTREAGGCPEGEEGQPGQRTQNAGWGQWTRPLQICSATFGRLLNSIPTARGSWRGNTIRPFLKDLSARRVKWSLVGQEWIGVEDMAQWGKVLPVQARRPELIPGTHGRRREPILKSCLSDLYTYTVACAWPRIPSKGFGV